ncbi:MAG: hypothetical protein JRJ08_05285 [Deltaproteobacteria bacterium]|nr:hypothetical protein [Deltaproteobacteria bacterium]
MKKTGTIILILLTIVGCLLLARNLIAKKAVTAGFKAMTGLALNIKSMNVGIIGTLIGINELKLLNPSGFPDRVMVDMPEIYIDYNLGAFFKKKVHLEEVRLNLKEILVVKNKKNELNIDSLKRIGGKKETEIHKEKTEQTKIPPMQIDILKLKIGKVIYKDYSKGEQPKVRTFDVSIDERFENITDPQSLVRLIVMKALMGTTIAKLADFDLGKLKKDFPESMKNITEAVPREAITVGKDAVKETTDALKNIIPFGK